jgi:hypothetical protein
MGVIDETKPPSGEKEYGNSRGAGPGVL